MLFLGPSKFNTNVLKLCESSLLIAVLSLSLSYIRLTTGFHCVLALSLCPLRLSTHVTKIGKSLLVLVSACMTVLFGRTLLHFTACKMKACTVVTDILLIKCLMLQPLFVVSVFNICITFK